MRCLHLSDRQTDVLKLLALDGASNKEIARKLDISGETVKVHMRAILRVLEKHNRTEAAIWYRDKITAGGTQ